MQPPDLERSELGEAIPMPAAAVVRSGVAWNSLHQVFSVAVSFGSMLVLVRIIPPREYGRAGAVSSLLALFSAASCRMFILQALQLPGGVEPDWSQHLGVGLRIQLLLTLLCNAVATVCWFLPAYRPIALLLHVASAGFLLDAFAQPSGLMLERALNFRRLRILGAISTALYAITMLALGLAGLGALAIVLSSLTGGLAPAFDLVFVRRWRPRPGWWQNPNWRSYRPSLRFGALNIASNVLSSARSALEFAVLPARAGFVAIGLWSRAQALFTMSIGRLMTVLQQTVYPLLPRYAAHRERYPRQATLFAQVMIWLLVPSAIYLGLEGKALSRIFTAVSGLAPIP